MKKILTLSLFLFGFFLLSGCAQSPKVSDENLPIFFYGRECPHCQEVEDYFEKEKVAEKVNFQQAEVYHNKENGELMKKKAEICGLDTNNLGVPMLFSEGKCLVGSEEIIAYFNQQLTTNN